MAKERKKSLKLNPEAFKVALASFFLMGLGQWLNKQKFKAIPLFAVLLVFVGVEIATSSYFYMPGELQTYPVDAGQTFNMFRDYGGIFTRGIWGLITLGSHVIGNSYRGGYVVLNNNALPWLSADSSINLMGEGIISLVILSVLVGTWIYSIRDAYKTRLQIITEDYREDSKTFFNRVWHEYFALIIMAPALVLIAFFIVVPFIFAFLLAFTNYTYRIALGQRLIEWTGFEAFTQIIKDPGWLSVFGKVFIWTLFWALMSSVTVYFLGFIQAMIVENKYVKGKTFWRLILILPWALPAMITLMTFKNVFDKDGLANQILFKMQWMKPVSNFLHVIGLQGRADVPIFWFDPHYNGNLAKAVVILVNLWLGAPYFMMLIIGVLNTISKELYEAASIDGASGWKKMRYITLPLVLQGTIPVIVMTFSFNFNNFGAIYFLTGGGPAWNPDTIPTSMRITGAIPGQTDILISWIYKLSFGGQNKLYNIASVYSILIFMLVGAFSIYQLSRAKSFWEED